MENEFTLLEGNNLETLKTLPDNSVDSVVTDPPYGLSFMNKKWDYDVPSVELWREVYRVLKPGGHLLSFGGTRTYHRMVVNIEDAGFEIRDQIMWLYGSGFPKSLNIGKAIDKVEGNEREVVGENPYNKLRGETTDGVWKKGIETGFGGKSMIDKGDSEGEGWGTGLKPANEPIVVARKPISENTIAENFIKWGVGGFNIDECRVGLQDGRFPANIILECICDEVIKGEKGEVITNNNGINKTGDNGIYGKYKEVVRVNFTDKGDIHTNPECPCRLLDDQSGDSKSSGSASRFFYVAKTSKAERNMGLDEFEDKESVLPGLNSFDNEGNRLRADGSIIPPLVSKNNHPTIKPVNLMSYLCKLVTPNGGVILDPFMGSGGTGIAALLNGFKFIGCELDPEYCRISEARISQYEKYKKFLKK